MAALALQSARPGDLRSSSGSFRFETTRRCSPSLTGRGRADPGLAQASRARLIFLRDQDHQLQEQVSAYEQHWMELSLQVMAFEVTGQTEERDYFPVKARQLATEWEMRQRKAKLQKNAARGQSSL